MGPLSMRAHDESGTMPGIPPKANRHLTDASHRSSPATKCDRAHVRRVATRHNRLDIYFSAVGCMAATVSHCL